MCSIWPHRAVFAKGDSSGCPRQVLFVALFFFPASEIIPLIYLETFIKDILISPGMRHSVRNKRMYTGPVHSTWGLLGEMDI